MSVVTLTDAVENWVKNAPEKVAFTFLNQEEVEEQSLTYLELANKAKAIASRLQEKLQPGDRAVLLYPPGLDFVTAFFGCLYAGVIAVPAYPPRKNRSSDRIESIIADSGALVGLTDSQTKKTLEKRFNETSSLGKLTLIASDSISPQEANNWKEPKISRDTLAFFQYTSGSTGTPKGVMVSHNNLIQNSKDIDQGYLHDRSSTMVSWLPTFHDMGLIYGVIQPVYKGFHCYLMASMTFLQHPIKWLRAISKYKATHSGGPNFAYELCTNKIKETELADLDLSQWKVALSGAEPVQIATLNSFYNKFESCGFRFEAFSPAYGLAETTLKVSAVPASRPLHTYRISATALEQHRVEEVDKQVDDSRVLVGCGNPEGDTEVCIVDPNTLSKCPIGNVGEIWAKGPSIALGYWKKEEETIATFQAYTADGDGPYLRTGDLGFWRQDDLVITGRLKDLIIVRGQNHYPQDIEYTVEQSHEALVAGGSAAFSFTSGNDEMVVVVAEIKRSHVRQFDSLAMSTVIKTNLAKGHGLQIGQLVFIKPGSLPKTSSGKVQRKACARQLEEGILSTISDWNKEAPQTPKPEQVSPVLPIPGIEEIVYCIKELIAEEIKIPIDEIETEASFDQFGLDSLASVNLIEGLGKFVGIQLNPTMAYDYPTIITLATKLTSSKHSHEKETKPKINKADAKEPIAIVGMACRFPGASDIDAFWELLADGKNAVSNEAHTRWADYRELLDQETEEIQQSTRYAGLLDKVQEFDPKFFGISAKEARSIDPQQRLLMEVSWEALENACIPAETLAGKPVGVYVGISSVDYSRIQAGWTSSTEVYAGTGNAASIAANRLSYLYDFRGPSLAVDTACSSSLVALHQAVRGLQQGDCETALVGGVNLLLSPDLSLIFAKAGMLAPDGKCKTFDNQANGYVRGEGCGMIVLKPLSVAKRENNRILGLIKGSALTQDGKSHGLTAPNGPAQEQVIKQALREAGAKPGQISYLEAHGTGTSLGDPIEVNALASVLMDERKPDNPLWIGSVKTNIGHLEAAAGIAGLIKAILVLQHKTVPPHLHFKSLNKNIELADQPVHINGEAESFPPQENKRLATVSSFGFGGTNAHVVLEEGDNGSPSTVADTPMLFTLSARSEEELRRLSVKYSQFLSSASNLSIADLCYSSTGGRSHFKHRLAFPVSNQKILEETLQLFQHDRLPVGLSKGEVLPTSELKTAFLFTGQGSQYLGMGQELYANYTVFHEAMNACDELFSSLTKKSLIPILFEEKELIHQTEYTQPALFAFGYSLYKLWESFGIQSDAVLGHSVGEYTAAVVAGVFELKDAMKLLVSRGKLMQSLPANGGMHVVFANREKVSPYLEKVQDRVSIAAINSPHNTVISGENEALTDILKKMAADKVVAKALTVSHAFHSPMMQPMLDEFSQVAKSITYKIPSKTFVSNLSGKVEDQVIATPKYWIDHILAPVDFNAGICAVDQLHCSTHLEIGPKPILTMNGRTCLQDSKATWVASINREGNEVEQLLKAIASLYTLGHNIVWDGLFSNTAAKKIAMPTYAFQRKRYWFDQLPEQKSKTFNSSIKPMIRENGQMSLDADSSNILPHLVNLVAEVLQESPETIDINTPFLEMGADSLVLSSAVWKIQKQFGIKINISQLFGKLTTLKALANFIAEQGPKQEISTELSYQKTEEKSFPKDDSPKSTSLHSTLDRANNFAQQSTVESLMQQQLEVMKQQLTTLQTYANKDIKAVDKTPGNIPASATSINWDNPSTVDQPADRKNIKVLPFPKMELNDSSKNPLSGKQQGHLNELIGSFTRKTSKSKAYIDEHRPILADNRASAGFRLSTKEMLYPIVGKTSRSAHIIDLDGNKYIDLAMGFGVNLFGHNPERVRIAIQNQLDQGMHLGPLSDNTGEVAKLITELTKTERVAFCNTGTEAIMTALRIARAVTNRSKIVIFSGSYHGHFDGTLGMAEALNERPNAVPMAAGILQNMVEDLIILELDNPKSLQVIEAHREELAGILVEPVQSRKPHIQPASFLRSLRQLADKLDVPLIFDEMIAGFRIAPGGAQEYFEVQADLVTYGKILGGGLPIGAVAGKRKYMDAIDGGTWEYGDRSYPKAETTFFAGTFCKHPLTLAASEAVLRIIKEERETLYPKLNARTSSFVKRVNILFHERNVPMELAHFGSLFYFLIRGNMDLFFFHLVHQGVYIWEGKTCFFSTAHTDADVDQVFQAIQKSIEAMQTGGFLKLKSEKVSESSNKVNNGSVKVPLSEAQRQLWLLTKLDPEASKAYHLSAALDLQGNFQLNLLQKALNELIIRHEVLRTTIDPEGNYQIIHDQIVYNIEQDNIETGTNVEFQLTRWSKDLMEKTLDLYQSPLFEIRVLKINSNHYLLFFKMHHILSDGWTLNLLLQELAELYNSRLKNQENPLKPVQQFKNFIDNKINWLSSHEGVTHKDYWQQQLVHNHRHLQLPVDRSSQIEKQTLASRYHLELDPSTVKGIQDLSKSLTSTPFMTLFSAFSVLMYRLTNQQNMLIGMPVSGRSTEEEGHIAGYCAHLLPIAFSIEPGQVFSAYASACKQTILNAYNHQEYPFAEMLNERSDQSGVNQLPVNVIFNMDPGNQVPDFMGLDVKLASPVLTHTAFDLSVNIETHKDRMVIACDYKTGLFDENTIARIMGHYEQLLQSISKEVDTPVAELTILSQAQTDQAIHEWNQTQEEFTSEEPVHQLFESMATSHPDAVALHADSKTVTYRKLNEQANELAHHLIDLGIGTENTVGIHLKRSPETIVAILGILKSGAAFLPMEEHLPVNRLAWMIKDAEVQFIVTNSQQQDSIPHESVNLIFLDKLNNQDKKNNPGVKITADHLCYLIYTSGSTGIPKGCQLTHGNLGNYLLWASKDYLQEEGLGHFSFFTPLSFDFTLTGIFLPLITGNSVWIHPYKAEIPTILRNSFSAETPINCLKLTPAHINLLEELKIKDTNIRKVIVGGEALTKKQVAIIHEIDPTIIIINEYGPTEATIGCLVKTIDSAKQEILIGRPIANTSAYIVDELKQLVPIGVVGELCISGKGLSRGYLKQKDLTNDRFVSSPFTSDRSDKIYRTGDLARYRPDGEIEFIGRKDNQLKIRGFRVEPTEIELCLNGHEAVNKNIVMAEPDQYGELKLTAYVQLEKKQQIEISELREYLKERLPSYMIPMVALVTSWPLTENGKVDRDQLISNVKMPIDSVQTATGPKTDTEVLIASMWKDALNIRQLGIHDNFYDLGGYSLLMMKIHNRLAAKVETKLDIVDLFQYPTIAKLASFIDQGSKPVLTQAMHSNNEDNIQLLPSQKKKEKQLRRKSRWI